MRVQWVGHEKGIETYTILQVPVNSKHVVCLHPDRELWRSTLTHWDSELSKRVPCQQPGICPYCPRPSSKVTYMPGVDFNWRSGQWDPRIVYITDSMRALLDQKLADCAFLLTRTGRNNSPIRWSIYQLTVPFPKVPRIDVEPSMRRAWGCQGKVDRKAAG